MRTDSRSRKTGRFVSKVQKELQKAVVRSGLRQQQIAEKLGVDRSIVNRRLTGGTNLTLRSIADLAWALDEDIVFEIRPRSDVVTNEVNLPHETTLKDFRMQVFSEPVRPVTAGAGKNYTVAINPHGKLEDKSKPETTFSSTTVRLEAAE
jgi:transcriptional regulator with XRE-family HTH domain